MAAYNAAALLGEIGISDEELDLIRAKDAGLYQVGFDRLARHARYFTLPLNVDTAANNNSKDSPAHVARFRFLVFAVDFAAEVAGGTEGTMDLRKALAADPTSFSSMLEAAVDVKTTVGINVAGSVTSGKEVIEIGDRLRARSTSTSAADQTGARALLHCIRL